MSRLAAFLIQSVSCIAFNLCLANGHWKLCWFYVPDNSQDCVSFMCKECTNLTLHVLFNASLAPLHGFAFWFDVEFNGPVRQKSKKQANQSLDGNTQNASPSSKKKKPDVSIVLSTAPEDAPTHWQQVIVFCSTDLFLFQFILWLVWYFHRTAILTTPILTGTFFADPFVLIWTHRTKERPKHWRFCYHISEPATCSLP